MPDATVDLRNELLEKHRNLMLGEANEAATRLKVIDRILRDILQWEDEDINPEERVSEDGKTTFSDYVLRTANTALVVEAKKAAANFVVASNARKQKLNAAFVSGELGDAIIQARDYARKLGIEFAAVTNGAIWVIFPAQRHDVVRFNESYAFVFPSLESALHDDFQEFVSLLSRDAVVDGSLESALIGRSENQFGARKLGNAFSPSHREISRNAIYPLIEEAVTAAFSDSISEFDGDLLEKCYVSTPDTTKFDQRISLHISKRDHLFSTAPVRPMKSSESNYLKDRLANSISKARPLAILLLGTVGAGKTTFLHYTRKVKARKLFEPSKNHNYAHWIYIDFRDCPDPRLSVQFIYECVRDYMIKDDYFSDYGRCVGKAFKKEIDGLRKGPMHLISANKELFDKAVSDLMLSEYARVTPYVDRILKYASTECSVFLVIDNIDQIENEADQSTIFGEAISLAHKLGINLVMAMRGGTYARHKNSPTFDAFDFDPLQIDPPIISSVLSRRFHLCKQLLDGQKGQFTAENGALVKLDNVAAIIDLVQASVLGTEIGNRIEVLAADDVRFALRMTREFLEYGYSNFGNAWDAHRRGEKYVLPKHEAFRAILLGNRNVYSEEYSPIGNPFDARLSINSTQLLRLYVLTGIVNCASTATFRHIDGTAILECLRRIGFGDAVVLRVLTDLCRFRFIHTSSQNIPDLHSSFVPSRLGGYVVRDLIAYFPFLENLMFDTYISDSHVWDQLRNLSHEIDSQRDRVNRVDRRIERVRIFVDYLSKLYEPLQLESQKRNLPAEWCSNPFIDTKGLREKELTRVANSVRRVYGGTSGDDTDNE
ncbi:hypothetical protein [Sterolibacterium denitrificans]|uniref:hypothetical protein n=1 Tax=Sterolibacterium denitrificans TaxID=157592 RepID=UPI0012B69F4E|nr:hypothetical protein [Sterolibacterium denitrificans]